MPNNRKVSVKKIKLGDSAHPSSRKARQLTRAVARVERVKKHAKERIDTKTPKVERFLWFKSHLDNNTTVLTRPQLHELVKLFLSRYDEELESLIQMHREGRPRPKAAREDALIMLKQAEQAEYVSGFELPDLTSPRMVKLFKDWGGDPNSLKIIKLITLRDPGNIDNIVEEANQMVAQSNGQQ